MQKFFSFLILFFILGLGTVFACQKFINWDKIFRPQIELYLIQNLRQYKISIAKISLSIFKRELILENLVILSIGDDEDENVGVDNYSWIETMIFKINLPALMKKKIDCRQVFIKGANLSINVEDKVYKFIKNKHSIPLLKFSNINIELHNFFSYDRAKNVTLLSGYYSHKNLTEIELQLQTSRNNYKMSFIDYGKRWIINILDAENHFTVKADTNFIAEALEIDNGEIYGNGDNFFRFLNDIFITDYSKAFTFIKERFDVTGNFFLKNNVLQFDKMKLTSDLYDLSLKFTAQDIKIRNYNIDCTVSKFDFEALLANQKFNAMRYFNNWLSAQHKYNLDCNIEAENLFYQQNDFSSKIIFSIEDNNIFFNKFRINIKDKNFITAKGNTIIADDQKIFHGFLESSGSNINIFMDLFEDLGIKDPQKGKSFYLSFAFDLQIMLLDLNNIVLAVDDSLIVAQNISYADYDNVGFVFGFLNGYNLNFNSSNYENFNQYLMNVAKIFTTNNSDFVTFIDINSLFFNDLKLDKLNFDINVFDNKFIINNIKTNILGKNFGGYLFFNNRGLRPLWIIDLKVNNIIFNILPFLKKNLYLPFSEEYDLDVYLRADSFYINDVLLKEFLLNAFIENHLLKIKKCKFSFYNSQVELVSFFDFKNFIFKNNFIAKNITFPIHNLYVVPFDKGTLTAKGYLQSYGKNLHEIVKKLYGKIKIVGNNLSIKNFDIDYLVKNLLNIKNEDELDQLIDRSLYGGSTTFNNIDGELMIKNGLMDSKIKFLSQLSGGIFSGKIDLWKYQMDAQTRFVFVPYALNSNANSSSKKEKFAIDVKLKGIMDSPERYIDKKLLHDYVFMGINPLKKQARY